MADKPVCSCGHASSAPVTCDDCGKTFCAKCWDKHKIPVTLDARGQPVIAELHEAYVWDCDSCGMENTLRPVRTMLNTASMPDEDKETLMEQLDMRDEEELERYTGEGVVGQIVQIPTLVVCKHCKAAFVSMPDIVIAEDASDDDEDDD
jgi:hypothetical protein